MSHYQLLLVDGFILQMQDQSQLARHQPPGLEAVSQVDGHGFGNGGFYAFTGLFQTGNGASALGKGLYGFFQFDVFLLLFGIEPLDGFKGFAVF